MYCIPQPHLLPMCPGTVIPFLNKGMLRKELDVFASTSIVKNLPGNWHTPHQNVDVAIIRENTEGEYSGKEHEVSLLF